MPPSDDTEREDDDPAVSRAIARLRQIARVLGRPVSDFFEPLQVDRPAAGPTVSEPDRDDE